ncbi:MAG: hypothetical protein Kilf2KO_37190 [Rhodospirillales bacterium]
MRQAARRRAPAKDRQDDREGLRRPRNGGLDGGAATSLSGRGRFDLLKLAQRQLARGQKVRIEAVRL